MGAWLADRLLVSHQSSPEGLRDDGLLDTDTHRGCLDRLPKDIVIFQLSRVQQGFLSQGNDSVDLWGNASLPGILLVTCHSGKGFHGLLPSERTIVYKDGDPFTFFAGEFMALLQGNSWLLSVTRSLCM